MQKTLKKFKSGEILPLFYYKLSNFTKALENKRKLAPKDILLTMVGAAGASIHNN